MKLHTQCVVIFLNAEDCEEGSWYIRAI